MPSNKDSSLRLEIIDQCLRNSMRKWTLESLIETVNEQLMDRYGKKVTRRTIQNDLKSLVEQKDAPLRKRKEGNTTYFLC